MAKFEVTALSFIGNKLVQPGEVVEIDTKVMKAGSNLKPAKGAKVEPEVEDTGKELDKK